MIHPPWSAWRLAAERLIRVVRPLRAGSAPVPLPVLRTGPAIRANSRSVPLSTTTAIWLAVLVPLLGSHPPGSLPPLTCRVVTALRSGPRRGSLPLLTGRTIAASRVGSATSPLLTSRPGTVVRFGPTARSRRGPLPLLTGRTVPVSRVGSAASPLLTSRSVAVLRHGTRAGRRRRPTALRPLTSRTVPVSRVGSAALPLLTGRTVDNMRTRPGIPPPLTGRT